MYVVKLTFHIRAAAFNQYKFWIENVFCMVSTIILESIFLGSFSSLLKLFVKLL